mmetsp:Transcript_3443/g.5348  ORF Transcript_3443/g.5348 Transcript_3443/m.5348 type:complete len:199 (-) Transcript_3443:31-627(-)
MSFARNTDATIGELKKQIVENEDIPEQIAGRIVLRPYTAKRADKALAEDVRLGDLCNEGRTKLLLRADISGTEIKQYGMEDYKLKIKGLSGATIEIGASHTDLVYMVKRKIEKMEGLSVKSQRLVFAGKGLEDLRTLRDYSICRGSCLHLIVRGGADIPAKWTTPYDKPSNKDSDINSDARLVTTGDSSSWPSSCLLS